MSTNTLVLVAVLVILLSGCSQPGPATDAGSLDSSSGADSNPSEPSFADDPEQHFNWFVKRYLAELPKLESTPYRDTENDRDERAAYEPRSHEIEFMPSDSADEPATGTLTAKIASMEVYDGKRVESFVTDFKFRFEYNEGRWEILEAQMYDPTFESWDALSDLSWEAPLFEAVVKVYGK